MSMNGRAQRLRPGARAARGRRPRLGAPDRARPTASARRRRTAPPRGPSPRPPPSRPALAGLDYDALGVLGAPDRRAVAPDLAQRRPTAPREIGRRRASRWSPRRAIFGDAATYRSRRARGRAHRRRPGAATRPRPRASAWRDGGARAPALAPRRVRAAAAPRRRPTPRAPRSSPPASPGAGVERLLPADRGPVRVEVDRRAVMNEAFLVILIKAVVVVFVVITALRVHAAVGAQADRPLPGALRPEPRRPDRLPAAAGRRGEADLQGGLRPARGPTASSSRSPR